MIDFACHPESQDDNSAYDRLATFRKLQDIKEAAAEQPDDQALVERIDAHLAYLRALMGEGAPLDNYILATQGCHAHGWPEPYIQEVAERAKERLEAIGIQWGPQTRAQLAELEQKIDPQDAPAAIEQAAHELEPAVRRIVETDAPFSLVIEVTNTNAYWGYWTDGAGPNVRVQLNMKYTDFTKALVRQFALHEVLGHGLQSVSYTQRCKDDEDIPWVRLMSVHAQQQVLLEGLAQAMPLFVTPDDSQLVTRARLDHFTQLVRSTIHVALDAGCSI